VRSYGRYNPRRDNPIKKGTLLAIVGGGAAIGLGIYFLTKSSSTASTATASLPAKSTTPASTPAAGDQSGGNVPLATGPLVPAPGQ
jgi:hypothetical protein